MLHPTYKKYLAVTTSKHLFDILNNLNWITKRTARHEYFMSNEKTEYSYGNAFSDDELYVSQPFDDNIKWIRDMLFQDFDVYFNGCFLNKYDDQHQHLGWHADDFEGMDQEAPIYVLSLGAEREIWWKEKGQKGEVPEEQRQLLESGSLFIMPPGFQDSMLHRIPKHDRPCGPRISLTFRKFL